MSKFMQLFVVVVAALLLVVSVEAGVYVDVAVESNGDGENVYTLTAISDGAPITSLGINVVVSAGCNLGQIHPAGLDTYLGDYNAFFGLANAEVNQDTQALFSTVADSLLVVSGAIDTEQELDVNFTGFVPFTERDIVQIVVTGQGEGAFYTIGAVAGGVEYWNIYPFFYLPPTPPEPGSVVLLGLGSLAVIRRR